MAEKSDDEEENVEGELDFESPNFNPVLALRLGNLPVPYPNIKTLNNLAEYHSLVTRTSAAKKQATASTSGDNSQTRKREDDNRTKDDQPVPADQTTDTSTEQPHTSDKQPSRHDRNIFTRMETRDHVGPLSLLRRCVYEKHRVKVWTRSAGYIRGFCQGFIVAYDKHLNLAMIDVDETYRKPVFPTKRKRDIKVFPIVPSGSPGNSDEENSDNDNIYSQRHQQQEQDEEEEEEEEEVGSSEEEEFDGRTRKELRQERYAECREKVLSSERLAPQERVIADILPGSKLPVVCLSSRIEPCLVYSRLKTKVCLRHVNQLFIRGDNVVSVAIAN